MPWRAYRHPSPPLCVLRRRVYAQAITVATLGVAIVAENAFPELKKPEPKREW